VDTEAALSLRQLLATRPVGALATLHRGEPAVSMVPFVLPAGGTQVFIHVSGLATHTRDMQQHPRVSLLVMAEATAEVSPQALPRVALQAEVRALAPGSTEHAAAHAAYLQRFPDAAQTFALADFSLLALQPVSARLIAGFGRAYSLAGLQLADWLRG
jgi:putative heme iron utilization protein